MGPTKWLREVDGIGPVRAASILAAWSERNRITCSLSDTTCVYHRQSSGAALRMRLGTLDLSTSNGRIVIDDPTVGAFSFVVPAADVKQRAAGHYRVDLPVFHPGKVKSVFTRSIDVAAGETTPGL